LRQQRSHADDGPIGGMFHHLRQHPEGHDDLQIGPSTPAGFEKNRIAAFFRLKDRQPPFTGIFFTALSVQFAFPARRLIRRRYHGDDILVGSRMASGCDREIGRAHKMMRGCVISYCYFPAGHCGL